MGAVRACMYSKKRNPSWACASLASRRFDSAPFPQRCKQQETRVKEMQKVVFKEAKDGTSYEALVWNRVDEWGDKTFSQDATVRTGYPVERDGSYRGIVPGAIKPEWHGEMENARSLDLIGQVRVQEYEHECTVIVGPCEFTGVLTYRGHDNRIMFLPTGVRFGAFETPNTAMEGQPQ